VSHLERAAGESGSGGSGQLVLLRFSGDVTTKAPATRRRFLKKMTANIRDALRSEGVAFDLVRTHNRLFVDLLDGERGVQTLSRIFGVQSLAAVEERPWESLDDIVAAGVSLFGEAVRDKRFAVRARRVGDRRAIPLTSDAVQRSLGAALAPLASRVDLSHPEVTASVELMPGRAYFFSQDVRGYGGLPLGCEGRAVALVSGGFDSPVAAWQLMKRGVALDYVFCNLGGRAHQLETLHVMDVIARRWSYGTRPHFHAIDFDAVTRDLQAKVTTRFWQIVLKRLMLRVAEAVASEREASAIITGEAVGQVSSQTLENLAVISGATPLTILRPLVGQNKDEIIAASRVIGTHDLSMKVGEYCAIVPSKPATRSTRQQIEAEEAKLEPHILERAIAERTVFDLRSLDLGSLDRPDIQIDHIPDGAVVLDLRSKAAFQGWHHPDALFLDFQNALRVYPQLDAAQRYVLYCEFGLKSAHLAELMRRAGLEASHFAGGLKALIGHARERGLPTPEL
jgi:thiamine biosynthesis protein ThiI